jgi:hypothetical protein
VGAVSSLHDAIKALADEWSGPNSLRADAWLRQRETADRLRAILAEHPTAEPDAATTRALLASDWLRAHDAEVRRATGVQVAREVEALAEQVEAGVASGLGGDRSQTLANVATELRRIAREATG